MGQRKINTVLFCSVSTGVTGTGEARAWKELTNAVNAVSSVHEAFKR